VHKERIPVYHDPGERHTCGGLPGVGDEGGVVLDLVGEDGGAVVSPGLPHHHRVLAVALHPVQVRRVRHVLKVGFR